MKRNIVVAVLVVSLTAALSASASALDGHVALGGAFIGSNLSNHYHLMVSGELQLTEKLFVGADVVLNEPDYELRARYGAGTGLFARVYFASGELDEWNLGVYFERAMSDKLEIRAVVGVYGSPDEDGIYLSPDAIVGLKYDLAGPYALLAQVVYPVAGVAIAYEF